MSNLCVFCKRNEASNLISYDLCKNESHKVPICGDEDCFIQILQKICPKCNVEEKKESIKVEDKKKEVIKKENKKDIKAQASKMTESSKLCSLCKSSLLESESFLFIPSACILKTHEYLACFNCYVKLLSSECELCKKENIQFQYKNVLFTFVDNNILMWEPESHEWDYIINVSSIDSSFNGFPDFASCVMLKFTPYNALFIGGLDSEDQKDKCLNQTYYIIVHERNFAIITSGPKLIQGRYTHECCALYDEKAKSNKIYILGGIFFNDSQKDKVWLNSCEKIEIFVNKETILPLPPMNEKRSLFASVIFKNNIYAIGGFNGMESLAKITIECMDLENEKWSILTLNTCQNWDNYAGQKACIYDDSILIMGGSNGKKILNNCFSLKNQTIQEFPGLSFARSCFAVYIQNKKLFVTYGYGSRFFSEEYISEKKEWGYIEDNYTKFIEENCFEEFKADHPSEMVANSSALLLI